MEQFRRLALLKRLPKFHPLPTKVEEIVPADERSNHPSFTADFELLQKELVPYFRELDNEAARSQNQYRWTYIILIFGGSLATILAIIQLAFIDITWIGIVGALVAALLTAATALSQSINQHERYMNNRLAAERLRSEYFLFLGHLDHYAKDQDRVQNLLQRVVEFRQEAEGSGSSR